MGFEIAYASPDGAYVLIDRWHAVAALMQNDIARGETNIYLPSDAPHSLFDMAERLGAHAEKYADFLHGESDSENDRMRAAGQLWQDDMLLALSYLSLADENMIFPKLRVHLSSIGHPILGDDVYGRPKDAVEQKFGRGLCGQTLHAGEIRFIHPRTGESMALTCQLPDYFEELLRKLRMSVQ